MPPEREANLRAGMASVVMFFAERYGIAPPEVSVVVDPDLWTIGVASPGTIRIAAGFVESEVLAEQVRGTLAHEYYHVLQFHLRQEGPGAGSSPAWITEGAATYAQDLYERAQSGGTAEAVHVGRWRHSLGVARPLRELESNGVFREEPESWAYSFGALAVEWLSGHAEAGPDGEFGPEDVGWTDRLDDDGAHLDYYRLLASGADWQEAFAIAFGLSPDEFYAEFEAYRAELGPRLLPHLADEVDEPVVSWSGRVSDATVSAARAELARIDLFHGERLEAGPADYTVHLAGGPDELASASRRMLGVELPASGCRWVSSADPPAAAIVIDASCRSLRTSDLADFHRRAIIGRLLPVERFVRGESSRGPYWLQMAIDSYATHHYEIVAGMRTLDEIRPEQVQLASRLRQPLRTLVRASDVLAAGYEEARALSFLAGEWLVDRAGEASLFEFYRGLQSGATWQEAFEAAFGIAAADFLDAFEAYRGGVSPAAAS